MIIELYHGSDHIIEQPELGKGRLKNDYGKGFYCTEERDLAREWGVSRSRDGIVNQYQLETNGLTLLDLGGNEFCVLHWLTVLPPVYYYQSLLSKHSGNGSKKSGTKNRLY